MTGKPDDASREGAQMSFDGRMSYSDYLHLERLLDAQEPLSDAHDELLFIIQHQTSELWMKLAIHEIRSAIKAIRHDQLQPAFKMLSRIARIFEQLNTAWDVLRTMTPSEYTEWRVKRTPNDEVLAAWKTVYASPANHWMLYELAEKLVDFEDYFRRWRFNHVTTVERIIGLKRGTGGTSGASYLRKMLDVELFPELWRVRTVL